MFFINDVLTCITRRAGFCANELSLLRHRLGHLNVFIGQLEAVACSTGLNSPLIARDGSALVPCPGLRVVFDPVLILFCWMAVSAFRRAIPGCLCPSFLVIKDGEVIDRAYHADYNGWIFSNHRDSYDNLVVGNAEWVAALKRLTVLPEPKTIATVTAPDTAKKQISSQVFPISAACQDRAGAHPAMSLTPGIKTLAPTHRDSAHSPISPRCSATPK